MTALRRGAEKPPEGLLGQPVQEHLHLKTFEANFNVQEFISTVSDRLITDSKTTSSSFDAVPLISSFEAAVGKLISMRKELEKKIEHMGKGVTVAEREYSRKMSDLNKGFEAVGQSFSNMETKMSDVGRTAIRIGDQLESVHMQRERSESARDLVDYYMQFSRGDLEQLDALRKQRGKEGKRRLAVLLRRLSVVAKEVDLPTANETRERIDKYCEKFEKDMLDLFDRCYRKEDPKMMHFCAQTLQDFNGGTSCVQIYVNQHDFFINRVRQSSDFGDDQLWQQLPDPNAPPPQNEKGLKDLFGEIRTTVGEEAHIVQAVFPNPPVVMQVFLQRIFAQSIQQHMEQLLNKGSSLSSLAFLRILQMIHVQVNQLIEDLKGYEIATLVPRSPLETAEHRRSLDASVSTTGIGAISAVALGTMLETAVDELFVPYIEGQRYMDRELKSLGELYATHMSRFTRYHLKAYKTKSTMFDRMVNQLSAAAATTSASMGSSTTGAQAAAALMKLSGVTADRNQEEILPEEDGILTVDFAGTMLQWHVEAIGRCMELSPTGDIPKHMFALLRVLADAMGISYVEVALEAAQARLEGADPKTEPNLQGSAVVRTVDLICRLWQQYVNTALLPLASASVTIRREMETFNNQTISRIEGSVNSLVQRTIDAVLSHLSSQLQKQKKNDFKPRNDDISFARVNTEPCELCCDVLDKVRDSAYHNLSGKNLEAFLTEIGDGFLCLLLEHFRKFPVNATGGLMLAKDLKSYQDVIHTFKLSPLQERFEFLRQLGNVFLVRPEILKSYVRENYLGKVDAELLRPYLSQRSDWAQVEKAVDGVGSEEAGVSEAKGLRDRLGMPKLSALMKELESLRPDGTGVLGGIRR